MAAGRQDSANSRAVDVGDPLDVTMRVVDANCVHRHCRVARVEA
jgi:hypothetical protein